MRRAAAIFGLAIAGSQAGHLLAYELRFGAAAQQVQSSGAHAYFPLLVKTFVGAGALALIVAAFLIGLARVAAGRKVDARSAPSLIRLVSLLYTVQLACFIVQETVEGGSASEIVLWGLAGQLPVALVGAVAIRWLLARFEPALAWLRQDCRPLQQLQSFAAAPVMLPALVVVASSHFVAGPSTRRGPPLSSF